MGNIGNKEAISLSEALAQRYKNGDKLPANSLNPQPLPIVGVQLSLIKKTNANSKLEFQAEGKEVKVLPQQAAAVTDPQEVIQQDQNKRKQSLMYYEDWQNKTDSVIDIENIFVNNSSQNASNRV